MTRRVGFTCSDGRRYRDGPIRSDRLQRNRRRMTIFADAVIVFLFGAIVAGFYFGS